MTEPDDTIELSSEDEEPTEIHLTLQGPSGKTKIRVVAVFNAHFVSNI